MAATDLARVPRRETRQKRAGSFRGAYLPEADRQLAAVKVAADLRNAFRPDGADEVRRSLGMVNEVADAYVRLDGQRAEERAHAEAAQAAQDEALGRVVEGELPTRSTAYRTAISWSRVRKRAAELEVAVTPEVEALLAQGANADPTRGDEVVDLEDVNTLLDDRFKALLLDGEGKPVDFGDAAANTYLYDRLNTVRTRINARAAEIIQQQEEQKVLLGLSDEVELDAKEGDLNVETYVSRAVTLGIAPGVAKETFLTAAVNGARVGENPEVLLTLADSRREDGTPSWAPAEENQLREAYFTLNTRLEAEREQEAQERSQATVGRLEIEVRQGLKLNPERVRALIASGDLQPEDADVAFAIQDRFDDNQYQQVQRARADIAWRQSQADRAQSLARARRAEAEESVARNLRIRILSGELSGPAATRAVRHEFGARRLTVASYERLLQEARQVPLDANLAERAGAQSEERTLRRAVDRGFNYAGTPGHASVARWTNNSERALETFYDRLRQGERPLVALDSAYRALGVPEGPRNNAIRQAQTDSVQERARPSLVED